MIRQITLLIPEERLGAVYAAVGGALDEGAAPSATSISEQAERLADLERKVTTATEDALAWKGKAEEAEALAAESRQRYVAVLRRAEGLERRVNDLRAELKVAKSGRAPSPQQETARPQEGAPKAPLEPVKPQQEQAAESPPRGTYKTKGGTTRRLPAHPGIEAVPEDLRGFPAAQRGGPLKQRVKAAAQQKLLFEIVVDRAPRDTVMGDIVAVIGDKISQPSINRHLKDMAVSRPPLLRHTRNRRGPGQTAGRAQVAYLPADAADAEDHEEPQRHVPEEGAPDLKIPGEVAPTETEVRDYIVGEGEGMYSAHRIAEVNAENGWRWDVVLERLRSLVRQGILADESPTPDMPLFSYSKPADPGAAAKLESKREPASEGPNGLSRFSGAGPSGRAMKVTNSDVRKLVEDARRAGADVSMASSGHIAVRAPNGRRALIACTPRSSRTVDNDRTRLRRIGLEV